MSNIASLGPPCIWTRGARNAAILTFTTGCPGSAVEPAKASLEPPRSIREPLSPDLEGSAGTEAGRYRSRA